MIKEDHTPPTEISTGWEYRWENTQKKGALSNSLWKAIKKPVNPPERNGNTILWLRYKIPDGNWQVPALLIDGKGVLLTFEIFLDHTMIYEFGKLTNSGQGNISGVSSHLIPLGDDIRGKTVMFRVFSDYSNIGIRGNVFLGSKSALIRSVIDHDIIRFLLGFFMVLIGLIELYIFRKNDLQIGPISMFGILAISLGLYIVNLTSLKDLIYYAPVFWLNVYIAAMALIPVGAMGFMWQTFRPIDNNYFQRISQFHIGFAVLCQAAFILASNSIWPLSVGTFLLNTLRWLLIPELVLMIGIVAKDSLTKGNKQARIYFCGFLPILLAGARDLLIGLGKIESSYSYVPWALMIFILSQEIIQRRNNIKTQNSLKDYAEKLERKSKEKAELNRDLHDGIGGLITNIKFLAEMGRKNPSLAGMKETFSNISALSSDSLIEIGSIMRSIDEEEITWTIILNKFNNLGDKMIKPLGLSFELQKEIDATAPDPDFILFLNLLRIYKEALTNISKHAKAKCVSVNLVVSKDQVSLSIKDDGIGFEDHRTTTKGNGLKNMNARAGKIGGKLSISSEQGTGVLIKIVR
jgi:signal transduction histidine kinase